MIQNRISLLLSLLVIAIAISGCASSRMRPVPAQEVKSAPDAGKAIVVFMRPSMLGGAIQSVVFEVVGEKPQLVGIVSAKKKVAYEVSPGKHLFMVYSEAADFMSADLAPGKTYYALVTPRFGVWKARFSLRPISAAELASDEFKNWSQDAEWVANTPEAEAWAQEHIAEIQQTRADYYRKWMLKSPAERPALYPVDGQ